MFSPNQEIWRFAQDNNELGDWLSYAEELVKQWADQNKDDVSFETTFEIVIASFLLIDNLLPQSAVNALARTTLQTINEAEDKKYVLESLKISPPPPGRKRTLERFLRHHEVRQHIDSGLPKSEAYELVALKYSKSTDTIRRAYERAIKRQQEQKGGN